MIHFASTDILLSFVNTISTYLKGGEKCNPNVVPKAEKTKMF